LAEVGTVAFSPFSVRLPERIPPQYAASEHTIKMSLDHQQGFTADQATVVFNTNVIGILRTSRAVLPSMREKHDGLIINVGSILDRVTFPFFGIYGASTFAVEALTDSLRYEVSQLGVDVTLVQPSAYPTNLFANVPLPADGAASRLTEKWARSPE